MKKILPFILLFIFMFKYENATSQSGKFLNITYVKKLNSKLDITNNKSYKNQVNKLNSLLVKYTKEINYQLIIENYHSIFSQNESKISKSDYNFKEFAGTIGGTKGSFYVNKKTKDYLNQYSFLGDNYLIKTEIKKWKITNEFKFISDFKCYKAISEDIVSNHKGVFKSKVIAWFCPELPSFFGPAGYFGLPGLILELDNGKMSLLATKIHFSKVIKNRIKPLKKGIKLTEKEFDKLMEKKARVLFPKSFKNK